MSSIGPALPPHLAKRKRDEDGDDSDSSSPPPKNDRDSRASSPDAGEKRRRVMGPALPPAPLDEMPGSAPDKDDGGDSDSSSSDDDDWGPAPPTAADAARTHNDDADNGQPRARSPSRAAEEPKKAQRDEWMMVPPKQDDLAARMDPTKLRARGFQTGKGARAPNKPGGDIGSWTETPEQKRKRLENEVMGVTAPGSSGAGSDRNARKQDEATARRVREHNEKNRGQSLYEQHRARVGTEADDDPSKRAFDYEKDMGSGMRIDASKRKDMVNRASDFGSKFSGGKYL